MSTPKKRNSLVPFKPTDALVISTSHLNEACAAIDSGDIELTSAVTAYFKALELEQGKNVDAVLADINVCYARVDYLRALKKAIDREIKNRTNLAEAIEKAAIDIVDAHPDIPFSGTYEKLATAKNPPAAEWTLNVKLKKKSFANVIPFELIDEQAIPLHHLRAEQVFVLDLKAIAADLKKGAKVPYAKLTQGKRLNPKPKD